jgi:hypothetical protein
LAIAKYSGSEAYMFFGPTAAATTIFNSQCIECLENRASHLASKSLSATYREIQQFVCQPPMFCGCTVSYSFEVTLPLSHGPTLLDISMIHPCCATCVAATSQTRGPAAALRDRDKYRAHTGHLHPGHTFVPASVEMYGHLGRPIIRYLRTLTLSGCHPGIVPC